MEDKIKDNHNELNDKEKQIIDIVKRQTNYDDETIITLLKENEWDFIKIIKKYLDIDSNKKNDNDKKINANQGVIKEMRSFLDDACSKYYLNKEIQEILEKKQLEKQIESNNKK